MNLQSILKLIPSSTINNLVQTKIMPGMLSLLSRAKDGIELAPGESSAEILLVEDGAEVVAVVVTIDENLTICRKLKKYPISKLLESFDIEALKKQANEQS